MWEPSGNCSCRLSFEIQCFFKDGCATKKGSGCQATAYLVKTRPLHSMASRHGCAEATEGGGRGGRLAGLAWQLSRQPERQKGEQANKSYLSGPLFSFFIHFILALGLGRARALARSLGKVINAACKLEGLAAAAAGLTVPYCTVLHFLSFCVGKSD